MRFRYLIVDVFSATPFGGNQLAVLPDARGLSSEGMQAVTREFNFPESTFVLPSPDPAGNPRVRIFTPGRELPFAGHPTVGTACALVIDGKAAPGPLTLVEGIGPVRVQVSKRDGALHAGFTLDQAPTALGPAPAPADAAAMLGLAEKDVEGLFVAELGVGFTFVQLASRAAVDRAVLDLAAWRPLLAGKPGSAVHIFAGALADGAELYARMFAPEFGIPEDPATGSAAGALVGTAALLAGAGDGDFRLTIRQGVAMGRPSLIAAAAGLEGGAVTSVEVGGATAFVAEGTIEVPEHLLVR